MPAAPAKVTPRLNTGGGAGCPGAWATAGAVMRVGDRLRDQVLGERRQGQAPRSQGPCRWAQSEALRADKAGKTDICDEV